MFAELPPSIKEDLASRPRTGLKTAVTTASTTSPSAVASSMGNGGATRLFYAKRLAGGIAIAVRTTVTSILRGGGLRGVTNQSQLVFVALHSPGLFPGSSFHHPIYFSPKYTFPNKRESKT